MAREVQRENRHDVLGEYIAQAYAQGLCKVPAHLKPPYNKAKFAYYRARLQGTLPPILPSEAQGAGTQVDVSGSLGLGRVVA